MSRPTYVGRRSVRTVCTRMYGDGDNDSARDAASRCESVTIGEVTIDCRVAMKLWWFCSLL